MFQTRSTHGAHRLPAQVAVVREYDQEPVSFEVSVQAFADVGRGQPLCGQRFRALVCASQRQAAMLDHAVPR